MTNDIIEIHPYDASWPEKAKLEIARLKEILNFPFIVDIKHFGSTAIEGLKAKPIIDIIIGANDLEAAHACIPILEAEGYGYWDENPKKDRMFFVKGRPPLGEKRTHHVHIHKTDSYEWHARPLFAEYLTVHKDAAISYQHLKEELAVEFKDDREEYTRAKAEFVKNVVAKAMEPLISFALLKNEHLPLLKEWLLTPHVKECWDPEIDWTDKLIKEKFGKYINTNSSTKAYVICVKDLPIGYIQSYSMKENPPVDDLGIDLTRAAGIDLFIGKEDFTGKGLSSYIINRFVYNSIWSQYELCLVDPEACNLKVIHIYEKCGFKLLKKTNNTTWMVKRK
jgi:GrpB-like predicted nucleotidyltransferase (UPF0157 family)